ncbi:MAG: hypothetical protein ABEK36_03625 [Candidatus Aenigmatarchaeota archaeon]
MKSRIYVMLILIVVLTLGVLLVNYYEESQNFPQSFEECVRLGGQVMESHPRQCNYDGNIFREPSCSDGKNLLTLEDAKEIARESECGDRLTGEYDCNNISGTYWLDLNITKEGCNPACVVDIQHRNATINWRCTGLIVE